MEAAKYIGAGLAMGLGAIGPAIGEGIAASKALEA
ncbi:MAG TPA: ATP F0F1 synthase subunit C, partial [bacterium]|nr:ATP F0F1 synthase subunit C [bacterium]